MGSKTKGSNRFPDVSIVPVVVKTGFEDNWNEWNDWNCWNARLRAAFAHHLGRGHDRFNDLLVTGAAADVAVHKML
jgi:hypothetical protein